MKHNYYLYPLLIQVFAIVSIALFLLLGDIAKVPASVATTIGYIAMILYYVNRTREKLLTYPSFDIVYMSKSILLNCLLLLPFMLLLCLKLEIRYTLQTIIVKYIIGMLAAAVVEELVFREYLIGRMEMDGVGRKWIIVASTLLFTVMFIPDHWWEYPQRVLLGLLLSTIYINRKYIEECIAAHWAFGIFASEVPYMLEYAPQRKGLIIGCFTLFLSFQVAITLFSSNKRLNN